MPLGSSNLGTVVWVGIIVALDYAAAFRSLVSGAHMGTVLTLSSRLRTLSLPCLSLVFCYEAPLWRCCMATHSRQSDSGLCDSLRGNRSWSSAYTWS